MRSYLEIMLESLSDWRILEGTLETESVNFSAPRRSILVVDDEQSIRHALSGILSDEGYEPIFAADAEEALSLVAERNPALVLLDIWLPGMDGLAALQEIKSARPDIPVVMMSGHASIATAVRATHMGAADFIEKPLDLGNTLAAVDRALKGRSGVFGKGEPGLEDEVGVPAGQSIDPVVFKSQPMRGKALPQRTLAGTQILYGQGLHSGKKSGLVLEPLPANSGIHFASVSEPFIVPAHIDYVASTGFATTVKLGSTQAGTIEHLMSALCAYGITNLLVKCNGEVPVMDGSALEFCRVIEQAGIEEQSGEWYELAVNETFEVRGKGREFVRLEPADEGFHVDYTLSYPAPLGEQNFKFSLSDVESYKREIAPARTFGFVKDIGRLQQHGLALGGRFDNFVLFGDTGPLNGSLRFDNEPVRHKILDAIGDLYLMGRKLRGKLTACMTGHSDNAELLKKIRAKFGEAV
jgi:UDP-3-O-[3-hydroxymyristoyl] N-acetylglucosamine deacetylase